MSEVVPSGAVSGTTLARLLNLSERRVYQLAEAGVIPKGGRGSYPLVPAVQGYVKYLQDKVTGGGGSAAGLAAERARLARAQANKVERQNKEAERELLPAVVLAQVIGQTGARVAGILDGIVPAVKRRGGLTAVGMKVLQEEVLRARQIAASMSLADLDVTPGEESDDEEEGNP